jgi:histidinol-phosphatase (PHP family)
MKVNCHVHTVESDGSHSAREVLEMAEKGGVKIVCFTDHFRVPVEVRDYKTRDHLDGYYDELEKLRIEFRGRVEVLIGVELDWISGFEDWFLDELGGRDYDFVIGSIHWLRDDEGKFRRPHLGVGGTKEFGGDKEFVLRVLDETRKMVEFGGLDCIGHLDAFVRRVEDKSILKQGWFLEGVGEVLDLMVERGVCLELNCSGFDVFGRQFPSEDILRLARERGVGVTVGNDFHSDGFFDFDFKLERGLGVLRDVGFEEVLVFRGRVGEGLMI